MPEKFLNSEYTQFFVKIIIPALLGVGMKLAIEMKKNKAKISFINVCLSMFVGVSGAYISSGLIQSELDSKYQSIAIAFIAIISDKVAEYIIYRLNIDGFLTAFFNGFFDMISNTFKRK
jgi:uncharacterized membrane protein